MAETFDIDGLKAQQAAPPAQADPVLNPGDAGYVAPVLKEGDAGYVAPDLKPGDAGYIAPDLKPGDEGYVAPVLKPGDAGYVAPTLKPGDEGYVAPAEDEATKKATDALLKKFNVKTIEELEEKLKTPETPEDILKRQKLHKASVDQFAQSKDYITREEIISLENMKAAKPYDVVYSDFEKGYLAKNKTATPDQIKQEFDLFYHQVSDNETLKTNGLDEINNKAANIIKQLEDKYKEAEEAFKDESNQRSKVPEFKNVVQSVVRKTPEKMTLYKDGENEPITFDITKEDREEVEKFLVKDDAFELFMEKGSQPTADLLQDRALGFLWLKNKDKMMKTIYDAALSKGTEQGSTTGANASFEVKKIPDAVIVDDKNLSDSEKEKLKGLFG